jgi:metal-sulfur cluster biosynthetic enzyme
MNEQLTVEQAYDALRKVIDPELYHNIVDLGLVYGVEVREENRVLVVMTLTTPHCPMGPQILADVDKFLTEAGATAVDVQIVWQPMWTPALMTAELKAELGIEEYGAEEVLEPEPEWTPPPTPKKKGLLGWLFK